MLINFEEKLDDYAKLLIHTGLNVNTTRKLIIKAPIEASDFTRRLVKTAYACGCPQVIVSWRDDFVTREEYLHADPKTFDSFPLWCKHFHEDYAKEGVCYLYLCAEDPENLKGVDPDRLLRSAKVRGKELAEFYRLQSGNRFPWCVASVPVLAWAKQVFGKEPDDVAMDKLWEAIFASVRVTGDGKADERWHAHLDTLSKRADKLNALCLHHLHYKNSLGTDFTIPLAKSHVWTAGNEKTHDGHPFVANMPTEEIFTSPNKFGANGVIYASMPLVRDGNIIKDFSLTVKDGKIVDVSAKEGEDVLKSALLVDEGSAYFGEVALIPYASPIAEQNILFYETLFDENASCHLAFGQAYPCIVGGEEMSEEEQLAHGLNQSVTHVDFMIGTPDLSIVGVTEDGTEMPIFIDGNFVF